MSSVAAEDIEMITHIQHVCNNIHDFGDELYEDMMDRDHESAKEKSRELIKVLAELIQSMTDEI